MRNVQSRLGGNLNLCDLNASQLVVKDISRTQSTIFCRQIFSEKTPSQMFDWVLNTTLNCNGTEPG